MSPPQCLYLMRWRQLQRPSSFPRNSESRGYMKPQRTVERPGSVEECGFVEAVALAGTYLVLSGTGGCGDSWRPAASSVGTESRAKESFVRTLMSLRCPAQDPMGQPDIGLWRRGRHPMSDFSSAVGGRN